LARLHGRGPESGFKFKTNRLNADGFYASIGYERNGKYLEMR